MDLLLRNAALIDGTGGPARAADVAVDGDRIVAVAARRGARAVPRHRGGRPRRAGARAGLHRRPHPLRRADPLGRRPHPVELARGDERDHGELRVRGGAHPARAPRHHRADRSRTSRACRRRRSTPASTGASRPSREYLAALDAGRKRLNVGAFVGHSPLRLFVLGGEERAATADEVAEMQRLLRRGARRRCDRLLHFAPARPPGRLRTAGSQPFRRGRRGRRAGLRAGRGGQGRPAGLHRPGSVRRAVLRAGGAPRHARRPGRPWSPEPTSRARRMRTVERGRRCPARSTRRSPAGRSSCRSPWPTRRRWPRSTSGRRSWPCRARSGPSCTATARGATGPARRPSRPGSTAGRRSTSRRRRCTGTSSASTSTSWPASGGPRPST